MKRLLLLLISSLCIFNTTYAQITTTINPTIAQLQQKLQGSGVTVTSVSLTCPASAYALYSNGTGILSTLTSGILLTTGDATDVSAAAGTLSTDNFAAGSTLGDNLDLSGSGSQDACYIKFLITPNCHTLSINYVFASEEYSDYVNATFNDVFGFVIDGPNPAGGSYSQTNIALVPGTALPVSINNVNNGVGMSFLGIPPTGPCMNCAYFQDAPPGIGYDGSTTVLTASTQVTPCQQYTMTIGVWDVGDGSFDSGVFLDVNGLSCVGNPTLTTASSPSVICSPQTVTLTVGGGLASGSYTWSAPASGGLVTTLGQTVTANPTATTIYTVSYSDVNTCPGVPLIKTTTVTFTTAPAFSVTNSPNTSICAGQSVTLTATGIVGTYTWTPVATLSATSGSVVVATPSTTTTYTVTKAAGGCVSSTVTTVSVTSSSGLTVTPAGSSICPGQSLGLTASGGTTYTWTASSGTNPPSSSTVTVSPTITTTYTVLSTCSASTAVTVSVSAATTVTISPLNASICSGQSLTLTATGGSTYTWTASSGANPPNTSTVVVSPTTNTTYTVLTGSGTCTASAVSTITVGAFASVTVAPTNTTICLGQGASLTASGGSTYTWTASSGTNPPGTANVVVTPTTNTTYTVLTGSGSCTASAVTSVSVAPALSITATPNATTICGGGSVSITASGATSYTWSPAAGLSSTSGAVVTATPATSTNYVITGSNGVCTVTTSANVTVTIVNTTVTASAANYCIGATPVSLTASGATTYSWAPATGLSSTSGAVVTATPVVTTVYTVTGTSGLCSSVKTVTVTVPPTSTITITSTGTLICAGGAGTTLTASGANTYTWLPGGLTTASINANPATTTTYSVGGQTALGCVALPATITVSVAPALTPTVTASSATVCLSNTVSLAVVPAGPGISYTWTPAAAIQGANNTAAVIAKPTTTATVNYTVTVSNGLCISTATISVQPFLCVPPTADIQTITNDSICTNGCVTFTAVTTGSQPMTYQWVFPGGTPPTSNVANPQVCYLVKGNYPVTLIVVNAYGSDTTLKTNYINVADTPRVFNATGDTTLKIGQTTTIHANGTALNYYWYPNVNGSIACPTCSNTVVQPTVTTKYYVEASNSPYCKRRDSVIVKVDFTCGDFFVPNAFSPNGDGLNDMVNVHGFCIGTYNLQIFNRWGEKVFETSSFSDSWDGTFRGKSLDTGVFVYRADGITIDGKPFNIKGNITLIK